MIRPVVLVLVALLMGWNACAAEGQAGEFRGLWVTRYDYRTAEDVARVLAEAKSLGATDVFWQVRGQGDAFYASGLEPWGEELLAGLPGGAAGLGFDPLAVAVEAAHARGLRLHAWFNVMPLWKGKVPPRDPGHPYYTHAAWRLFDGAGVAQPLNDHYVIVNPVLPEVHDHIVAVARDIVERYAVDGLHLDYIRFVSDTMDKSKVYPGDPVSIGMFTAATGVKGVVTAEDGARYREWIRTRITDLVRRLKVEAVGARPGVVLTAAVWRRPEMGRDTYLQDGAAWINDGLIDRALPMIYTDKDEQFVGDLGAWLAAAPGKPVTPGLGTYLHGPERSVGQIGLARTAGADGFAVFAYASLFESANPLEKKDEDSKAARRARLDGLLRCLAPGEGGR